jgi:hypothetical protein
VSDEIELISDGDGIAVIGDAAAVDRFLTSEGLSSSAVEIPRLSTALRAGSAAAETGSELAAASGRWVKLPEESARAMQKYGLRESSRSGLSTGVLKGDKGQIAGFVEFARSTPGSLLTNPAMLAGVAGIMAQVAMKQSMDEITDYLKQIDEKVEDVLRAQKDEALARMIGVAFVIDEAMTLRESRGRVDEVTWSKIQTAPTTIAETQAYALRRLDALAEKLESKSKVGDVAKAAKLAERETQEWLAVLARCFQLQDAIAVLELDRVLDASPDELDGHRLGLRAARQKRLDLIAGRTENLLERISAAAETANLRLLLHPAAAPGVVRAANQVSVDVVTFQRRLGIDRSDHELETRRWVDAAADARDKTWETSASGLEAAKRLGADSVGWAKTTTGGLSSRFADRALRARSRMKDDDSED